MAAFLHTIKRLALMSSFLLVAWGTTTPALAQQDAIARFFSDIEEEEGFTSVFISSRMFRLIANLDKSGDNSDLINTINQLGGLRILAADSIYGKPYYNRIIKVLNSNRYEELMRVKESKGELVFLIQETDEGKVTELLMLSGGDNSFFMLSFIGENLDIDQISKLGESVDIEGLDQLDKLKNKRE